MWKILSSFSNQINTSIIVVLVFQIWAKTINSNHKNTATSQHLNSNKNSVNMYHAPVVPKTCVKYERNWELNMHGSWSWINVWRDRWTEVNPAILCKGASWELNAEVNMVTSWWISKVITLYYLQLFFMFMKTNHTSCGRKFYIYCNCNIEKW